MSKNLFEQIDEEKKDIPKIDKALKQAKKYKYNFYQKLTGTSVPLNNLLL